VELQSRKVKTATTVAKRLRLLPMVAPAFGIRRTPWAASWLRARAASGLGLGQGDCLLPARSRVGWTPRPTIAAEAGAWLRDLLVRGGACAADVNDYTSHSLKCTTLAWCAKAGVDSNTRRHLGHHVDRNEVSMCLYGRDNSAAPVRELVRVMLMISEGTFRPDHTRSGMMVARSLAVSLCLCNDPEPEADENPADEISEAIASDDEVASDLSKSDHSGSEDEILLEPANNSTNIDCFGDDGWQFVVHCALGTVHKRYFGFDEFLVWKATACWP
jgi:hypothetical protein